MIKNYLILIFLSFTYYANAQENTTTALAKNAKNDFYLSIGYGGVSVAANLNYERKLWTTESKVFSSIWIKANGGVWAIWDSEGTQFSLAAVGLSGHKNHHIEYSLGGTSLFDKVGYDIAIKNFDGKYVSSKPTKMEYTDFMVYATLGYRYQKPGNGILFRAGFGYPEMIYVSIGYGF